MNPINTPEVISYLNSLRKNSDPLLEEMELFARENKIPILDSKSAEFIEQLVLIKKPEYVLEIGTAIAYTTIRMARLLPESHLVDTIELSKHNIPIAKSNIQKAGLGKRINLLEGNAKILIPKLEKKYDFVFLDADKEDYLDYYEMILPVLNNEGILVIDNLLWKGNVYSSNVSADYKPSTEVIKKMNKFIINDPRVITTILPIGDGLGVCLKK